MGDDEFLAFCVFVAVLLFVPGRIIHERLNIDIVDTYHVLAGVGQNRNPCIIIISDLSF